MLPLSTILCCPSVLHQPSHHLHPPGGGGHRGSRRREQGKAGSADLSALVGRVGHVTGLCAGAGLAEETFGGEVHPSVRQARQREAGPGEPAA